MLEALPNPVLGEMLEATDVVLLQACLLKPFWWETL
jgi:hypothetical protein